MSGEEIIQACFRLAPLPMIRLLRGDANSKVACETATKDNMIKVAGEITAQTKIDYERMSEDSQQALASLRVWLTFPAPTAKG